MIMVAGAAGHLDSAIVNHRLLASAKGRFVARARNGDNAKFLLSHGVETRLVDCDQPETLPAAFGGIETLLLISTMPMDRSEQQICDVDAAIAAGVEHTVDAGLAIRDVETSGVRDLMSRDFETEAHIRSKSCLHLLAQRDACRGHPDHHRSSGLGRPIGPRALVGGIFLPVGKGRVPYALRAKMGPCGGRTTFHLGQFNLWSPAYD